jgi:hypothetical protein
MKRVTVAVCPDDTFSLEDARSFAAYMEEDLSVLLTYVPGRYDSAGNPVWVASAPKPDWWLAKAQAPFGDRPEVDTENAINMAGAERAYNALTIWDGVSAFPQAAPGRITAIAGMDGPDALAAMGVKSEMPDDAADI